MLSSGILTRSRANTITQMAIRQMTEKIASPMRHRDEYLRVYFCWRLISVSVAKFSSSGIFTAAGVWFIGSSYELSKVPTIIVYSSPAALSRAYDVVCDPSLKATELLPNASEKRDFEF